MGFRSHIYNLFGGEETRSTGETVLAGIGIGLLLSQNPAGPAR